MGAGRLGWVSRFTNTRSVIQAKSARADVREMEGSLERVRASIAEVARKLAVYVRARLERSRGRSGPDSGGPDRHRPALEPACLDAARDRKLEATREQRRMQRRMRARAA